MQLLNFLRYNELPYWSNTELKTRHICMKSSLEGVKYAFIKNKYFHRVCLQIAFRWLRLY